MRPLRLLVGIFTFSIPMIGASTSDPKPAKVSEIIADLNYLLSNATAYNAYVNDPDYYNGQSGNNLTALLEAFYQVSNMTAYLDSALPALYTRLLGKISDLGVAEEINGIYKQFTNQTASWMNVLGSGETGFYLFAGGTGPGKSCERALDALGSSFKYYAQTLLQTVEFFLPGPDNGDPKVAITFANSTTLAETAISTASLYFSVFLVGF
ncbi:MAG: hypothetical protein MMC33_004118 [Icmadophila ericetorum]|nr:hypothetical protein [Icmadophila ericetorum]